MVFPSKRPARRPPTRQNGKPQLLGMETCRGQVALPLDETKPTTRSINVTPHVAQSTKNGVSVFDEPTTYHAGYQNSQRKRQRVKEIFGWVKTVEFLRKTRHPGRDRVGWMFAFGATVCNRTSMRNRMEAPA